jgi:O-antigen/teichoic acid export membrane protein
MNESSEIDLTHHVRRARILRAATSGLVAKAAFFLSALLVSRIAIPRLGPERFGVLMTVLSLVAFLMIADLGVGSSLVTGLSRAFGARDHARVRQLQINGLAIVCAMAFVIGVASVGLLYIDIGTLVFPASGPVIQREATISFATFGLLFALSLPTTLVSKIQLGLQLGHVANKWQAAAAIMNLAGGAFAALRFDSVPLVIIGMMVGTLSCGAANALFLFLSEGNETQPTAADFDFRVLKELLRDSLFYLVLQVIFTVTYASDTLIVAHSLGAEQASIFALSERIFSVVAVAVAVVSGPLWAAYGDAIGAADERWASATLRLSTIRIGVGSVFISLVILCVLQPIIRLLSTGYLEVPFSLAIAMTCWRVVEAVGASISVYLFAHQAVKLALVMGVATALTSLAAKLLLLKHVGVTLMPIATTACYVVCCLVPSVLYIYELDRKDGLYA